jgi:acyl-coenzyme A thioesterase PaaI-like protein
VSEEIRSETGLGGSNRPLRRPVLGDLGDATRALMDALVRTDVDDETIAAAAEKVNEIADKLNASHRAGAFNPVPDEIVERFNAYNPVVGKVNPFAPPMVVDSEGDGRATARVTLGRVHEGPPLAVHGGIVALMIDQLLGHAVAAAGRPGMTASLTVNYKRPTPFDTELLVEAWVTEESGRKILAKCTITANGNVTAEADAVFLTLTHEQREKYIRRAVGKD